MNKLIPVISLLAVLMATAIFLTQSDDSEALTDGNWEFTVDSDDNATITKYTKTSSSTPSITVPATVTANGVTYPVKTVGAHYEPGASYSTVFATSTGHFSLIFSEGIERIENYACAGLGDRFDGTLTLPSTLEYIGYSAFSNARFTGSLIIPDSVTYIGDYAFNNCQSPITKFKLSSSLTEIRDYAFSNMVNTDCDLIIPEGVTRIGANAFWASPFGDSANDHHCVVLPSSVTSIGSNAFRLGYGVDTLYNLSSLNITAGSTNYGNIAQHITTVYTSLPTAPEITSTPSATTIQIGENWSYTVTYTGTDAVMSATYPSWITQSGDMFTGTNAPGGNYPIEITVEDRFYRTAVQNITLTVTADYIVAIESSNTAYGTVDRDILTVPYNTPYSVSGNVLTVGSYTITATPSSGDAQYTYSLSGWNVSSGTVTDNMSIIANFVQTVNEYTVTIGVNDSSFGTVNTNSVTVPYGSEIIVSGNGLTIGSFTISATPSPSTAMWDYSFVNWSGVPSDNTVREVPIEITAQFEQSRRLYDITINIVPEGYGTYSMTRWDGSADVPYEGDIRVPYGTGVTSYGDVILFGTGYRVVAVPSPQEVEWTYAFDSWTIPSSNITGDMTINVNFTRSANTIITVNISTPYGKLYQDGVEYTDSTVRIPYPSTVSVEDGELHLWSYVFTADETVLTEQWEYTFDRWNGVPANGETYEGMSISAVYTSADRYYTVTFHIADGFGTLTTDKVLVLYNTLFMSENNVIVVGSNTITATPTPDGDGATYEFIRWDGLPISGRILEDTDISAKIQRTVTANAFNIVEIEHGEVERVWSIPDEYLPLMLVIPVMLLIGMVLLSLNRKSDGDDYESY